MVYELTFRAERALINGDWSPFDLDTVKLLMNIFDTDRSGTIGFNEFSGLWKYIKDWQGVFRHFDRDNSGSIDGGELSEALRQFGYNLSPQLLLLLERKYGASISLPKSPLPPTTPIPSLCPSLSFFSARKKNIESSLRPLSMSATADWSGANR